MPSAGEFSDLYEQLRRRVTEGAVGRRDGLAVLRGQGLHAWIALTAAVSRSTAQPGSTAGTATAARSPERVTASFEPSPLLSVCVDMLMSRLMSDHPLEETK